MFITIIAILMCLGLGFLMGMTYAEANLGKRVRDVRRGKKEV